ncbi:MAG: 4-hydroxy-3-methylbut-2-enyl diphosphate reductase, partial [Lentisphaeria bacterium]|nr:4-hydroxy-3-methylbut-2-enyl diphosphate reductase [Lentisphaeria bacterium]
MTDCGEKILYLASVRGFCGGVRAALAALEQLLSEHPERPVCVLHELVHNRFVTEDFERRGVRFLAALDELPPGAALLLGAHGVTPEQEREARRRAALVVDTTCPLVRERQRQAAALAAEDTLLLLGYPGHAEVAGIISRSGAGRNFVLSSADEAERLDAAVQ